MRTSKLIARSAAVSAILLAILIATGPPLSRAASLPEVPPGDSTRGGDVYQRYCTQCHGDRGDGKGEVAAWTQPKPRDFRNGVYKFRSTPTGTLPTTADLDRTIRDGLYGTLMPPFDALNRRARQDVIAYLQTFSPRWRKEQPGTPVAVIDEPTPTASIHHARPRAVRGELFILPRRRYREWASRHRDGRRLGKSRSAGRSHARPDQVGAHSARHRPASRDWPRWNADAELRRRAPPRRDLVGGALHPGARVVEGIDASPSSSRRKVAARITAR